MIHTVITGATKGIGRALAETFAREGHELALCARNADDLRHLADDLAQRFPQSKTHVFAADLGTREGAESFGDYVQGLWNGHVDVLIHNAGVFLPGGVSDIADDGSFEAMLHLNVLGVHYLNRILLPGMVERRAGHIFTLCSIASFMPYGAYSVSKFALLGYTKSLRKELLDHGIRVTAVMPGATLTPSWEGVSLPEERFMPAEDVAEAILSAYRMSHRTVVEEIVLRPQLGDL
jgi:short-subunit dehydrogenase